MLTVLLLGFFAVAYGPHVVLSSGNVIRVPQDYPTIQNALDHAAGGDTVLISNGVYYEHLSVTVGGYYGPGVKLIGEDPSSTIIDGGGSGTVIEMAYFTREVFVSNLTIRGGDKGIRTGWYSRVLFLNNSILANNDAAISIDNLYGFGESLIYHNTFMNNTQNIFPENGAIINFGKPRLDNGYPDGGNYWSDYNGTDLFSGPYQNETGSDGIGDTPYEIAGCFDYYPLMRPIHSTSLTSVHNINTGLYYGSIQEAIDAPETLNGHTILVESGVYYEHLIVDKSLILVGENYDVTIDGNNVGTVLSINASNVRISNFNIVNSGPGWYDSGVRINGDSASKCNITGNTIRCTTGIYLASTGSTFSDCILSNNTIMGNGGGAGIYMIFFPNGNLIDNNRIMNHSAGIMIYSSSNTISGNTITDNAFGITIPHDGNRNRIFHNKLINNSQQVGYAGVDSNWDDGYPSGGNYWSDYNGSDLYLGPYQNITGSDGIGDAPYVIDASNTDKYPLMEPFRTLPVRNLDTGLSYATIQEAINASETLDGHKIFVAEGTCYENVVVNKSISLVGENRDTTIIDGSMKGNVLEVVASNVEIRHFTLRNSGDFWGANPCSGISIFSNGNNISDSIIANNLAGITLRSASNNSLSENTVINNSWSGIYLRESSDNNVTMNNILGDNYGVFITGWGSSNNSIFRNSIINNNDGIWIASSGGNNSVLENTIANSTQCGIWVSVSSNIRIVGNTLSNNGLLIDHWGIPDLLVENNTVNSKPLVYLQSISDYVVNDAGQVILVNCTNIRVENLNLSNATVGLELLFTMDTGISGNHIANNSQRGVLLYSSQRNFIAQNNLTANGDGIELAGHSHNNTFAQNNITENGGCGVSFLGFRPYVETDSSHNVVIQNLIANNTEGISIPANCLDNTILENTIATNVRGVRLDHSSQILVAQNHLLNNEVGISLHESSGNFFYHNRMESTLQVYDFSWNDSNAAQSINAWDDGYPSGGNYWSDYVGLDSFSGFYQNVTGGDGIGDTLYVIDTNNQDNYPLMNPYSIAPTTLMTWSDKPDYVREESITLTAVYAMDGVGIENAVVLFEINYPNGTIYRSQDVETNATGTASLTFSLRESAPFGNYSVHATAYKPGLATATNFTGFIVAYTEPRLQLQLEGADYCLVNQQYETTLHVTNIGNATAYRINAFCYVTFPQGMTISYGVLVNGVPIETEQEILLKIPFSFDSLGRYQLQVRATYEMGDGTEMPAVLVDKLVLHVWHVDYPVDLVDMNASATPDTISLYVTVTNFGDWDINITIIASAQHNASKLMLGSSYETITLRAGENRTILFTIDLPSWAPTGEYIIQGILSTGLPNEGGFRLAFEQQTVTVGGPPP
jgi:parallel beta-helix repeat protein